MYIPSLDFHLNARLAVFKWRHKNSNIKSLVRRAYKKIKTHLQYNNTSKESTKKK